MAVSIVPLDSKKHKDLHVKVDPHYSHISASNMVPVVAFEFLSVSGDYPIVFVKQQETGKFKSVALMGLEEGENLYFEGGAIHADYVPINVRRYPFVAGGNAATDENLVLCIDENSSLINDKEGVAVFNEDGTPSEATQRVSDLLVDLMAKDVATDQFIDYLVEQDLLHATELTLKLGENGDRKLNGIYKVNEEKLNELSDDAALELYKRKYFGAIYAHLGSLSKINRVLQLKAKFKHAK